MQDKFQFPYLFSGVVIQREDKFLEVSGHKPVDLPVVKVRTEENEVVTIVTPKDVQEGLRYEFMVNGRWELQDGQLRHNAQGSIPGCHANDAQHWNPHIESLERKGFHQYNRSDMQERWSIFGGHITKNQHSIGVTMFDGGEAVCHGDRVDINVPSPMVNLASMLYAQNAWGKQLLAKGPDEFLMEIWDIAADYDMRIENFSPKNAVRGVYSSRLLSAPQIGAPN